MSGMIGVGLTPEQEEALVKQEIKRGEQQVEQREQDSSQLMKVVMEEFKKPFPKEAHAEVAHSGFTTIKAQYVTERLNNVMDMGIGLTDWVFKPDRFEMVGTPGEEQLTCDGTLLLQVGRKAYVKHASGGGQKNKRNTWGDVKKSAQTDAMTKAASLFGIGNDVFKGLVEPDGSYKGAAKKASSGGAVSGGFASKTKTQAASDDDEL